MEENKAEKKTAEMKISGMICASCSATIENALRGIDGISQANVNLGTETASIEYNPVKTKLTDLELAVEDAGYGVLKERVALKVGRDGLRNLRFHGRRRPSRLGRRI